MQIQKTTKHRSQEEASSKWHVIDAKGERLGRLATKVAQVLQGKHSAGYSPHLLTGDFVVVINASNIDVSGNKLTQKIYYRHTGYVGHLRQRTLAEMLAKFPERVIEKAVKGMLPRNKLARRMLRRLKVYAGGTHPHDAQLRAGTGSRSTARALSELASKKAPVTINDDSIATAESNIKSNPSASLPEVKSDANIEKPKVSTRSKSVKAAPKSSKASGTGSSVPKSKSNASTEKPKTTVRRSRTSPKVQE